MASHPRIDWSQLWYPGPKRPFTPDEMARAGNDAPSPTLVSVAGINLAVLGFLLLQIAPPQQTARLTGLLVGLAAAGFGLGRWLWWHPWRKPLMHASLGVAAVLWCMAFALKLRIPNMEERYWSAGVLVGGGMLLPVLLWFIVVWRAQQIEGRLREQAERERAIEMARRLAAAQIEPHFLFNTLASLQHWVQTKDDRAAPMLEALTGYLRATLPLFDRPLLAAGDELLAVERYLQVMQARLGARLVFAIDVPAELRAQALPPGLLLTLVENAVVHGIEPQLAGGRLQLRGWRQGDAVHFEVQDDGPGMPAGATDGIGLTNLRQRLTLTCGPGATLQHDDAPGGGCRAELRLPHRTLEAHA